MSNPIGFQMPARATLVPDCVAEDGEPIPPGWIGVPVESAGEGRIRPWGRYGNGEPCYGVIRKVVDGKATVQLAPAKRDAEDIKSARKLCRDALGETEPDDGGRTLVELIEALIKSKGKP